MTSHRSKRVDCGNKACYVGLALKRREMERYPPLHITIIPTIAIVAITTGLPTLQAASLPLCVDVHKLLSAPCVRLAIGQNTCSCAVFTAAPSLRVSRYVTKLAHTTMVTALSAHPMNSSHFVPTVAAQAGALPKMPACIPCVRKLLAVPLYCVSFG